MVRSIMGIAAVVLVLGGSTAGCGQERTVRTSLVTVSSRPAVTAHDTTTTAPARRTMPSVSSLPPTTAPSHSTADWGPPSPEVARAFSQLDDRLAGVRLYAPGELPADTSIAATWWPISSGKSPALWADHPAPNPRVIGRGADAEVRVALRVGRGDSWVEILERVKGDLGDLTGEPIGRVAGHEATAYRFMGGDLIQWSDGGAWFAVYGRNLKSGAARRIALAMKPTGP